MNKVRCAVIGCGSMAGSLVQHIPDMSNATLVAGYDPDPNQSRALTEKYGGEPIDDLGTLLARDDIDAVIVATPGFAHTEAVERAFAAGKHVFVEKPMALTPDECDRMIRARDATGKKLMVGQVLRYIGVFNYTRELLAAGKLGDIIAVRITRTSSGWGGAGRSWRNREDLSGGVLFEFSVHELDFMMSLVGDAKTVYAISHTTKNAEWDYPDLYMLNIGFRSGAMGQLTAGIADPVGHYGGEIIGTKGAVHFDARKGSVVARIDGEDAKTLSYADIEPIEAPVRREVREFIEAVLDDTPVTIPGEEGRRVVRLAHAAKESAREGRIVSF